MRKMSPDSSASSPPILRKTPFRLCRSRTVDAVRVRRELGVARRQIGVGLEQRRLAAADEVLAVVEGVGAALGAVRPDQDEAPARDATGAAAVEPAMNIVRGWTPTTRPSPRAPARCASRSEPQKAKPDLDASCRRSGRRSSPAGAGRGAAGRPHGRRRSGPRAPDGAGATRRSTRGAAAGPARGLGGSWKGIAGGILGESPHGMPPFGFGASRGAASSAARPPTVAAIGAGGRTVRAISERRRHRDRDRGGRRGRSRARCRSRDKTCSGPGFLCRSGCR